MKFSSSLRARPGYFLVLAPVVAALAGCSSSSSPATPDSGLPHHDGSVAPDGGSRDAGPKADGASAPDTGSTPDAGHPTDSGHTTDAGQTSDGAAGTTTIATARQASPMPTTAITVRGFVTALSGVPNDYPQWYIEDPAGGPYSGIDVYCDPLATKACTVPAPALHDLIEVTGTLTSFKGQIELEPTSATVIQSNAAAPPVATLTAADIAPSANSPYRGVYVKLAIPSKLVVDSVNPAALADTACGAVIPTTDGGTSDAGPPACSSLCEPPVYSGFRANDGTGNEVYVEAPFFHTDPLQSSPECLTQTGVVQVKVGAVFTALSGILDVDPYSMAQAISPVLPSDYTLNP